MTDNKDWLNSHIDIFWGEIAPCDHLVQIYEDDDVFLESLEGFASTGITAGDSVIIIATAEHLNALENRLYAVGFDVNSLIVSDQYIPLNAEDALAKFMVNGWPDAGLFNRFVKELIVRARKDTRKVRAFGEMVAILWANGHNGATVHLEHLWEKFCTAEGFCLFCAYPKSGFTQDANNSLTDICTAHTKMIAGWSKPQTEVFYKSTA
jgi:hypothetical protein